VSTGYSVQRLRLFHNNNELDNTKNLDFYNLLKKNTGNHHISSCSFYLLVIALRLKPEIDQLTSYIDVYGSIYCSSSMRKILENIRQGFNFGLIPKLTDDGTSGAY
jgi:hypothetical protein